MKRGRFDSQPSPPLAIQPRADVIAWETKRPVSFSLKIPYGMYRILPQSSLMRMSMLARMAVSPPVVMPEEKMLRSVSGS